MKKRFIAGAICPKCNVMDTMQLSIENEQETLTCIKCGEQLIKSKAQAVKQVRHKEQSISIINE